MTFLANPRPSANSSVTKSSSMRHERSRCDCSSAARQAVYVLHAFQKKTQATSKRDVDIARQRLAQVMEGRT